VLYEGLPTRPDGGVWWRIVEKFGVSVMFTSPTAIRVLKRQDPEYLRKYDTSTLATGYLAGEPLDEPTWNWIGRALQIPIMDNYWQTETGWPVLACCPVSKRPKFGPDLPASRCTGTDAKIVDAVSGETVPRGEKGVLAIGLPLPPGCMSTVGRMTNCSSITIAVDLPANSSIPPSITRLKTRMATFLFSGVQTT